MISINHFSLEMCRHLTSLAPGFEGHWWWVKYGSGIELWCTEDFAYFWKEGNGSVLSYKEFKQEVIICPAWQVEDLLRNWDKIMPVAQGGNSVVDSQMNMMRHQFANRIVSEFLYNPNTAYQKIEEYL